MTPPSVPTCAELFDHDEFGASSYDDEGYPTYSLCDKKSKTGWRHGTTETWIWHRGYDDTYWKAVFNLSTDSEYNGLRDGDANINRVYTKETKIVTYIDWPQKDIK